MPLFTAQRASDHEWSDPLAELFEGVLRQASLEQVATVVLDFDELYGTQSGSYCDGLNRLAHALQKIIPMINRVGIRLAITVRRGHFLTSPPEVRELLDQSLCPLFGAALWIEPEDERALLIDWMETLGRRLFVTVMPSRWSQVEFVAVRGIIEQQLEACSCPCDFLVAGVLR